MSSLCHQENGCRILSHVANILPIVTPNDRLLWEQDHSQEGAGGCHAPTRNLQNVKVKLNDQPAKKCATPYMVPLRPMRLEKTHCQKRMYMQYVLLAAIAHIMQLKCSFCGPDKGAIYCHAYLIYTNRICIMWNYIHIEIYVCICTHTVRIYTLCLHGLAMGLSERGPTV